MFEQVFKNIDDILHKDAGCSSELDYTEQTSWMLFLKYLDDLEYYTLVPMFCVGMHMSQVWVPTQSMRTRSRS